MAKKYLKPTVKITVYEDDTLFTGGLVEASGAGSEEGSGNTDITDEDVIPDFDGLW